MLLWRSALKQIIEFAFLCKYEEKFVFLSRETWKYIFFGKIVIKDT